MADFSPKIKREETKPEARDILTRLPGFLQGHEDVKRFFKGVANHFFEPSELEEISGFVGRRSTVFNPNDFYIPEATPSRQNYQLEPIAVSRDAEENINYFRFYEDLVDNLRVQGSLTENHARLFESEFWSWCPPINPDMLINFSNYYWLEEGPPVIEVTENTNVVLDMIGQVNYTFPDGTEAQSGQRVLFLDDDNTEFNNVNFLVVNVGRSIRLLDDSEFDGVVSGSTDQDYIVMERGANDHNAWSVRNRWFHRNQISNVDLTNIIAVQARRPIIQFEADLQLRDMGRLARDPVNLIHNGPLSSIQGETTVSVDGVLVTDGMRILVTGEPTAGQNNIVYRVTGQAEIGVYVLVKEVDGLNVDGTPSEDEVLRITQGVSNARKRLYWDGTAWITGQSKDSINQYPLFELYDIDGIPLDDEGIYPGSDFDGSFLFGFRQEDENPVDDVLGLRLAFNTFGEIIYEANLQTEDFFYDEDSVTRSAIEGLKFFRVNATTAAFDTYETDWRNPGWLSRQSVSDTFSIKQRETSTGTVEFPRTYQLSQTPEPEVFGQYETLRVFLNGRLLDEGTDYLVSGDEIELSLTLSLEDNDFLDARSFDRDREIPLNGNGYYRIPTNLQANPNNEKVTIISYNELFEHFISIIENQQGIDGRLYGINNFNSTARNLSAGTEIIQHSGALLKLMFLNQDKEYNVRNAIRYTELEYDRWYSKVESIAKQWIQQGLFEDYASNDLFIDAIISQINAGKDETFPFKNSGMIGDDLYIPPTPSYLGFAQVYAPGTFVDDTITNRSVRWRRGHDGSLTQIIGGDLDDVMLQLEQRIYDSIQPDFKNVHPEFSHFEVAPGKYRESAYSRIEWNKIMRPMFENWAFQTGVDHKPNTFYVQSDLFTYNYSRTPDRFGETMPGHWRGIYRYYFDTDRPHTHPWEMLGLGEKPSWWVSEYGAAPYTRENTTMWRDLEAGRIAQGTRAGIDIRFARPGLSSVIPIDAAGEILDPVAAGIIPQAPSVAFAEENFKFGDVSPVEWIWRISNVFPFAQAATAYLARPGEWLEKTWDTAGTSRYFRNQVQTQFVYDDTRSRKSSAEDTIHTDTNREIGSQQWVADFWLYKGLNRTTDLGDKINDLTVQLGHRAGSFVNIDGFRITSDNFGLLPSENVKTVLVKSASRREPVYSGLIVRWDGTNYRIRGYDPLYPTLGYFTPNQSGTKSNFTFGKLTSTLYSKFNAVEKTYEYDDLISTIQDVTNIVMGYGAWLESEGWIFDEHLSDTNEINDWRRMAKEFVKWADGGLEEDDVLFLSPYSSEAAFQSEFGLVDRITQYTNGSWTALDYEAIPMRTESFNVSRLDNQVNIRHDNTEPLAFLRLTVIEYDHGFIFDNSTKFGDLIYDPAINLRQRRFRTIGNRVKFWNGRFDAPGYLIQETTVIPNYDTRADNIRKFYDPYSIGASSAAFNHARHLVGYQRRDHMQQMLLDDRSQFNFFRGFLEEKGTKVSFDRLLRSTFIRNSQEDFQVFEEWAFKVGEYGARDIRTSLEFALLQTDIKADPQTVTFTTDQTVVDSRLDQVITIPINDSRWIRTATNSFSNKFYLRNFTNIIGKDLPTGGWAQLGELDYLVAGETEFATVYEDQSSAITEGQDVWVVKDNKGDWDIRRFSRKGKVNLFEAGTETTDPVTVRTFVPHTLSVGDQVIFPTTTSTAPDYTGTQTVSAVIDAYHFQIDTPATDGMSWITEAVAADQSPVTSYGYSLIIDATNILFTTTDLNEFSTTTSPENLNLGGLDLTVDGDSVTFIGNIVTGLTTNPNLRSAGPSTSMTIEGYPITFEHTNQVGDTINPTVVVDGTNGININGTDVVWTGTGDLDAIINDINTAAINRIFADKGGSSSNRLRIWNYADNPITLRSIGTTEDALEELGFAFNTNVTGTNTTPVVTVDASNGLNINGSVVVFTGAGDTTAIVNDINTAAIPDLTALDVGGAVDITHGTGGDIYIYNVDAAEDAVEIIGFDQVYAGKTTADYVGVMNTAFDITDIEATDVAGQIQLEKKNGGSITIADGTGTPSVDFGLRTFYASRTLTQIVAEMVAAGMPATEESDTSVSFSFGNSTIIAITGTAATQLGLESEYRATVSYADVVSQINAASIPNVEFENANGFLTFRKLDGTALSFSGNAASDFGFDATYTAVGTGPDFYIWKTMRRDSVANLGTSAPTDGWLAGERQFVNPDSEVNLGLTDSGNPRWSVYEYNGATWDQVRYQKDRIDTAIIESVFLFDKISNQTISQLSVWDPIKRAIPGKATSEVYYMLEIDPAVYNTGDDTSVIQNTESAWGIEQVGRVWWDINAVRYLDYEQSNLAYRRKYWGRKLPGSSIDLYEWTRSPVPPSGWDTYVSDQSANASSDYLPSGTVKNSDNPAWVERVEFDKSTQHNRTFYYFWVLNPRYRPNKPFRKISAFDAKNIIDSPKTSGVLYFSPVETQAVEGVYTSSFIVGNTTNIVINDDVIVQVNFRKDPSDDQNVHKEWKLLRETSDDLVPTSIWTKLKYSLVGEDATGLSLPDLNLNESRRYGVNIRPRQSMFVDRENARRTFVNASNRLLIEENVVDNDASWSAIFLDKDPEPTDYDFIVNTRIDRDALTTNPLFESGMTVLVQEDEQDKNKWTHWSYDGSAFTLLDKEDFDMQNYWSYVDWYTPDLETLGGADSGDGVSQDTPPTTIFATIAERDASHPDSIIEAHAAAHPNGHIVQVLDNGEGRWIWSQYQAAGGRVFWHTIAIEDGTVQLNDLLYSFDLSDVDLESEGKIAVGKFVDYFDD